MRDLLAQSTTVGHCLFVYLSLPCMCPSHQLDFTGAPWEWSSRESKQREEYFIEAMNLGSAQTGLG